MKDAAPAPDGELSALVVAVLAGGTSHEREVSLRSGAEVEAALRAPGGPREVRPVELLADGRWRLPSGDAAAPAAALARLADVDVFFLALHGGAGEDGAVQGFLECAGHAYTGSRVAASALCMDKEVQRVFLAARGVRIAAGRAFDGREWERGRARLEDELSSFGEAGWVVKPRRNGSSVGVRIASGLAELAAAVEHAFGFEDEVLVEERLAGVETTCGVLGNRGEELQALTPVEIRPHDGRFFDYEEKYSEGGATELCPPLAMPLEVQARVRALAAVAHRELGCDGYSRSDFIVPAEGDPVFLETNTLPGLTARSLLPLEAAEAGIDFPALCRRIVSAGRRAGAARRARAARQGS